MTPTKRGRKRKENNPLAKQLTELEKENRWLQQKLKKALQTSDFGSDQSMLVR